MSDLKTAIGLHQSGNLDRAETIYRQLLAGNGRDVDALHLLGVLLHQKGQNEEALPLVLRSVAMRPQEANFHCNLGEVHRAMGHSDKAIESYRTALRFKPDHPDALNNLGVALQEKGDRTAAIEQFQKAVAAAPRSWRAANNLGNALRLHEDAKGALQWFRKAYEIDPNVDQVNCNLGQALLESGDTPGALRHCQRAVELNPRMFEAHNNLGNVYREMEQPEKALECYRQALDLNHDSAVTYSNIGMALSDQGKYRDAIHWHEQSLLIDPTDPRTHCNLAEVYQEFEQFEEAKARYELVIQFRPDHVAAYCGLASVLQDMGHLDQAIEQIHKALAMNPELVRAHNQLGHILEQLGRLGEAEESFRRALDIEPKQPFAASQLAILLRDKLPDEDFQRIERLLSEAWRRDAQKAKLHFAMTQALDGRKAYAKAAEHAAVANRLRKADWERVGKRYDPDAHVQFVDSLIECFTPDFFEKMKGLGHASRRPIFIVGLPRSGTTLTEQILAAHSKVYGAGELRLAGKSFGRACQLAGVKKFSETRDLQLTGQILQTMAAEHLNGLDELNLDLPHVADKMPDNYLHLGFLSVLFPNATFIHTRRELKDVAVSCWATHFRSIRWACDLQHIAHRFEQYIRLMGHWRKVLPIKLLEIDYERTVTDLKSVAKRLISHCNLEWEDACMEFHKLDRPVRTASLAQVRKPIYTTSKERWKLYEKPLKELFQSLDRIATSGEPGLDVEKFPAN